MRVDKLGRFEMEILGRFLLQHMDQTVRGKLMANYPVIYRKLLGKDADDDFRRSVKDVVLDRPRVNGAAPYVEVLHRALGVEGPVQPGPPGVGKGQLAGDLAEILDNLEEDE